MTGVVEFARDRDAPARARAALDGVLAGLDADVLADVKLVVSELVTNSVKYGADGTVSLSAKGRGPRAVRLDVIDHGHGFAPARERLATGPGGWGLQIVDAIADSWGLHDGSTHVWCEIDRGPAAGDTRSR